MEGKGLCRICIHSSRCTFPRKFPVWNCEEYETEERANEVRAKKRHAKCSGKKHRISRTAA